MGFVVITHFITVEIDLQSSPADLHRSILSELQRRGEPLRWAITAIDAGRQKAQIEAVVTTAELLIPSALIRTI